MPTVKRAAAVVLAAFGLLTLGSAVASAASMTEYAVHAAESSVTAIEYG